MSPWGSIQTLSEDALGLLLDSCVIREFHLITVCSHVYQVFHSSIYHYGKWHRTDISGPQCHARNVISQQLEQKIMIRDDMTFQSANNFIYQTENAINMINDLHCTYGQSNFA